MNDMKGKHRRSKNPFEGDMKNLEAYGKGLSKGTYSPPVTPRLPKVRKPKIR